MTTDMLGTDTTSTGRDQDAEDQTGGEIGPRTNSQR